MTKSRGLRVEKGTRPRWVAENQGRHFCECGCGEPVELQARHYPQVPRFRRGHNTVVTHRKSRPEPNACMCGCGGFPLTSGSRYLPGHSNLGQRRSAETRQKLSEGKKGARNPMFGKPAHNRKPEQAATPCLCGCGRLATPGRRFITGHNNFGTRLSNYVGRYVAHGYVKIHQPGHPFADRDGYVSEHRIVTEIDLRENDPTSEYLMQLGDRLYLRPDIVVHHIDGVKVNNAPSNLAPMTSREHTRLHHDQGDIRG